MSIRHGIVRAHVTRTEDGTPLPPLVLVGIPHRLLPTEARGHPEQTEIELELEPAVGRDTVTLERGTEGVDGRLLARGEASAIEREIPGKIPAHGPRAGIRPVEQDRASVRMHPEIAHLPVAVQE